MTTDNFHSQHRGGKGIKGMQTLDEDFIEDLFMATTHHYLMFFTNKGRVYRIKAYEIPEFSRTSRGIAIVNLLQLMPDEKVTAVIALREYKEDQYLFMATKKGVVKKTHISEYHNIRKNGLQAINLREDDDLIEVKVTDNTKNIIMVTKFGQCIVFDENEVRTTGRTSMGVRGITLDQEDEVAPERQHYRLPQHSAGAGSDQHFGKRQAERDLFPGDRIYPQLRQDRKK